MNSKRLITVDLFAGAGGMTEGFRKAGYDCALAIEIDPMASKTFSWNHPQVPLLTRDIRTVSNSEIAEVLDRRQVDVVTGGPPCQMFSLAGPRIADDPRNFLFKEFVRVVKQLSPKYFVFENVVGLLNTKGGAVLAAILAEFRALGYSCDFQVLNAASYGVPQSRPRVIIMGSRISEELPFPNPTHGPVTNQGTLFSTNLEPFLTVDAALSNLPVILDGEGEELVAHPMIFHNDYQAARVGRREPGVLYNHRATSHSETIKQRYASLPEGGDGRDVPMHLRTKKTNIYRLNRSTTSRTVTCNHRTDIIHPTLPRGTTVREAARLQSFDDDYRFFGNLTRKARWVTQDDQVGNAVPPLLAFAIANSLSKKTYNKIEDQNVAA